MRHEPGERRNPRWLSVGMILGGMVMLDGALVLHWPGEGTLAKLGGAFLVGGLINLFRKPSSSPRSALTGVKTNSLDFGVSPPQVRSIPRAKAQAVPVLAVEWFWRLGSALGVVLLLVCLACLIGFWSRTPTVVIAGDFNVLTFPLVLDMLVLAMFVGISWARRSASSVTRLFLKSLGLGFSAFSLMLVPGMLTGSQIAESRAFSGPNTTLKQDFRIWWAIKRTGKNARDYAVINPNHIEQDRTGLLPEIPVTEEAFQLIRQANPEAPIDDAMIFYSPDKPVKSTNLCMSFIAQRAGTNERLLLGTNADIPVQAIHPCPQEAR